MIGPAVFIIKEDDYTDRTFKVYLGKNQRCSCGGGEGRGKLCSHLLYIMLKVLKVPSTSPLSWQLSLTDNEMDKILCRDHLKESDSRITKVKHPFLRRGCGHLEQKRKSKEIEMEENDATKNPNPKRVRKTLEEDSTCSICQEEMTIQDLEADMLCYCDSSCGSNFHRKCLKMCVTYARSEKKPILCPMCRAPWKNIPSEIPKKRKKQGIPMPPVRCQRCQISIRSTFYRCAKCHENGAYDLCRSCFENGASKLDHLDHPFVKAEVSDYPVQWSVAIPPLNIDRSNILQLQERELTNNDYNTLLSLDQEFIPVMHHHLVQAFPKIEQAKLESNFCVICENPLTLKCSVRQLPCSEKHFIHDSCALNMLLEAQSISMDTSYGVCSSICPMCGNDELLFPSLRRESIRRKFLSKSSKASVLSDENKYSQKDFMIAKTRNRRKLDVSRECDRNKLFDGCIVGLSQKSINLSNCEKMLPKKQEVNSLIKLGKNKKNCAFKKKASKMIERCYKSEEQDLLLLGCSFSRSHIDIRKKPEKNKL